MFSRALVSNVGSGTGTGIFNSPGRVIAGTNSTGAALLCWFAGIVSGLCGAHVYVEYGLNVPRYTIDGFEQTVPRSGGDLHYVSRHIVMSDFSVCVGSRANLI